jgi:hypothetical protein
VEIPWKTVTRTLTTHANGATYEATRDGGAGTRLSWVQTVYQSNQPIGGTNTFCVDACPPDDNLPFYWTDAELVAKPERRKKFSDSPSRPAPSAAAGDTKWRAVLSLAVVTGKRITVFDSYVWGFDMTPANAVTTVGPRAATDGEVAGHLNLLKNGVGTGAGSFTVQGWTFRLPPP